MTFAVVKPVPRRDFFSFCTTLRPIELKALGELSHVRHLQKGELIYTTGDLAEEVYSVNRGVVEVIKLIPGESDERSFVTRGDIFGVAEALGKMPRLRSARAQEIVSLQCFNRENFVAISQRVPSFLLFLCEQMATSAPPSACGQRTKRTSETERQPCELRFDYGEPDHH